MKFLADGVFCRLKSNWEQAYWLNNVGFNAKRFDLLLGRQVCLKKERLESIFTEFVEKTTFSWLSCACPEIAEPGVIYIGITF